jgi:hypothetical protein
VQLALVAIKLGSALASLVRHKSEHSPSVMSHQNQSSDVVDSSSFDINIHSSPTRHAEFHDSPPVSTDGLSAAQAGLLSRQSSLSGPFANPTEASDDSREDICTNGFRVEMTPTPDEHSLSYQEASPKFSPAISPTLRTIPSVAGSISTFASQQFVISPSEGVSHMGAVVRKVRPKTRLLHPPNKKTQKLTATWHLRNRARLSFFHLLVSIIGHLLETTRESFLAAVSLLLSRATA